LYKQIFYIRKSLKVVDDYVINNIMTYIFVDLIGTGVIIIVIGCFISFSLLFCYKRTFEILYGNDADKYETYYCDF